MLLVIDISGSMGDPATEATASRRSSTWRSRRRSTRSTSSTTTTRSGCGSSRPTSPATVRRRSTSCPSARSASSGPTSPDAIDDLVPTNGTPLYDVTAASYATMLDGFDPARINAVVLLTDGRNEDGDPDDDADQLDGLLDELRAGNEGQQTSRCGSSRSPTAPTPTSRRCVGIADATTGAATTPATRLPSTTCSPPWCPISDRGPSISRSVLHSARRAGHDVAERDPARGRWTRSLDRGRAAAARRGRSGCTGVGSAGRTAVPRAPRREHIDPFALSEPWRGFVRGALQAQRGSIAPCTPRRRARSATASRRSVSE